MFRLLIINTFEKDPCIAKNRTKTTLKIIGLQSNLCQALPLFSRKKRREEKRHFADKKRRQIWANNLHSILSLMSQAHWAPCFWSPSAPQNQHNESGSQSVSRKKSMQCDVLVCYVQPCYKKNRNDRTILLFYCILFVARSLTLMYTWMFSKTWFDVGALFQSSTSPNLIQASKVAFSYSNSSKLNGERRGWSELKSASSHKFSSVSRCEKNTSNEEVSGVKGFHLSKIMEGGIGRIQISSMASRLNSYDESKNWHASSSTAATMFTALKSMQNMLQCDNPWLRNMIKSHDFGQNCRSPSPNSW